MLDAQRYKHAILREEIHFTRKLLIGHITVGLCVIALLAGHGVMLWALAAAIWYLISLLPLAGMMSATEVCRYLLGLLFLLFSATGVFFLAQIVPELNLDDPPLLPAGFLPFWLGTLNLLYAIAGVCLMVNRKVRKAATIGFTLW